MMNPSGDFAASHFSVPASVSATARRFVATAISESPPSANPTTGEVPPIPVAMIPYSTCSFGPGATTSMYWRVDPLTIASTENGSWLVLRRRRYESAWGTGSHASVTRASLYAALAFGGAGSAGLPKSIGPNITTGETPRDV